MHMAGSTEGFSSLRGPKDMYTPICGNSSLLNRLRTRVHWNLSPAELAAGMRCHQLLTIRGKHGHIFATPI